MPNRTYSSGLILCAASLAACSSGSSSSSDSDFEFPAAIRFDANLVDFDANSAIITNPYLLFSVGRKTVFEGATEDGLERIEIEVLPDITIVNGVQCATVLDRVTIAGSLVEETWDWYAQDTNGDVWYMGENSNDYENGVLISTAGSWEAGKDVASLGFTAEAGIQMFANPVVGTVYHQEYYETEAEDAAQIVDLAATITLSDGTQYSAIKVKEWAPLDPTGFEYKFYVENVGLVLETDENGEDAIELISQQD